MEQSSKRRSRRKPQEEEEGAVHIMIPFCFKLKYYHCTNIEILVNTIIFVLCLKKNILANIGFYR